MRSLGVKLIAFFLLAPGVATVFGQDSDVWKRLHQKFPGEQAVYVERSEVLNLVLEGDSIKAWSELTQDMLHLKDQSDMFADSRIYGSSFTEVADIKAKTLVWERSRYKEMSVTSFKKNSSQASGIFYDDSYYYSFNFPSVASQSRTQLQYKENIKQVKFVSGFRMQSSAPHELASFTVKASKGIEIGYKVLNDKDNKVSFQKTEKGGFVYYQWTAKDLPAVDFDSNAPAYSYFTTYIECHVKSYTTKKGTVRVLSDLNDLHAWYNTFLKNLTTTQSPELAAVVKDIKEKSKNETEIVKNVFYWVQDNIKYIAFEQGMRGLIPHDANYVCEKRYGDCKDMANLIVTMLHAAGVNNAYRTWIGTRDLPYKYSEFPTPIVDNHMIATYVTPEGKYIFIDGTGNHTKLGFPSSMIQGKEAFISLSPDKYEVHVVPEVSAEESLVIDSVKLKLDDNKLSGTGRLSHSGYAKHFGAYELDRVNQDEIRNAVTQFVTKGSNKFNLTKYNVFDFENRDVPTTIRYEFSLSDYFQTVGDEIYINLNLSKDFANSPLPADRKSPREIEYKYVGDEIVELQLPDDRVVEYIPEDYSWDTDLFSFKITYTKLPGKIIYNRRLKINTLMVYPDQFKVWNDVNKKLTEAYKETIVLKKK